MHPDKDIKKLSELKDFFTKDEKVSDTIFDMLKIFQRAPIHHFLKSIKQRGYAAGTLLHVLLLMPFNAVCSIRALYQSELAHMSQAQKDAYYRLKNLQTIDWRKLLYLVAKRYREVVKDKAEQSGVRCLIVDDSFLSKTTRFTEGVSKVFDHVTRRFLWGFKLLLLGYWDGKSFIPLDFSLHREKGNNKKKPWGMTKRQKQQQYSKKSEKGTAGANRKNELDTSKIKQAIKQIRRAVWHGFMTDYVLADSWFFCLELIKCVRKLKKGTINLIAMAKMGKANYEYGGQSYTAKQLKQNLIGKKKRCRKLRATYIECIVSYQGNAVKLFLVRYSGQMNWQVLVSTDLSLSFIRTMEIYSIRWSIEVFFKEAKQHLQLGKSQSQDFDAQIADATIAMIQYTLLATCKRFSDYESFGELFKAQSRQMTALTLAERIWELILALVQQICDVLEINPELLLEKLLQNSDKQDKLERLLARLLTEQNTEEWGKAA